MNSDNVDVATTTKREDIAKLVGALMGLTMLDIVAPDEAALLYLLLTNSQLNEQTRGKRTCVKTGSKLIETLKKLARKI